MNQIIINGSHNRFGNTTKLIKEKYPKIDTIHLTEFIIQLYNYEGKYSNQDEFSTIINQILKYDTIIFATPVYWYSMSSVMKIFFDRLTDLITYQKEIGYQLQNKNIKVITISNGNNLDSIFFEPFKQTANYLGMRYESGTHYIASEL